MKRYLIFSLLLIIVSAGYSQPEYIQKRTFHIKKVSKNPINAEKLWLKCSTSDIEKLEKNVSSFTNLQEIAVVGGDETNDWNRLFETMSKISSLHKVIFINNYFNKIPSSTALLKQISSLDYYGSQQIQFDSCIGTLAELSNLKEISFDLFWTDDIPSHLYLLKNLQSTSFRFSMNFNEDFATAPIEDTTIMLSDSGKSFSITLSATENSLTNADIHDILARFPAQLKVVVQPEKDLNTASVRRMQPHDITFSKSYQNIHPPVSNLTVQKTYYPVNTDTITSIQTESGTTLSIPSDAFVDEKGLPVTGQVVVDYREFKDPIDFIFSGIPMSFDSGSQHNLFMSAGMFEINASVNGKEVFLKKGKKINVDFTTTDSSSGYTLFSFNDSTGHWKVKQDSLKIKREKKKKFAMSQAVSEYYSFLIKYKTNSNGWIYHNTYDSTLFDERFTDTAYVELWKKKWYFDSASYERQNLKKQLKTSNIRITSIRKSKNGDLSFHLDNLTKTNPELKVYKNSHWKVNQKMSKSELKAIASSKNHYNDVRIEESGSGYVIKLKTIKGFTTLIAYPVKLNPDNYAIVSYTDKEISIMYKRYSKQLSSRERVFNRELKKGKLVGNLIPLKPEEVPYYTWKFIRNDMKSGWIMTPEEKNKSFDDSKTYASAEKANAKIRLDASQADGDALISSFSIDGMGVWNCDQIKRLQNPVEILVQYENKSAKSLFPTTTYIINKKINGVLMYDATGKIAFSTTSDNIMLTMNGQQLIAVSLPDDFKNKTFVNEEKYPFLMDEYDGQTTSVAELKKLMGYK